MAKNIKIAESAKILENIQRDVNIALMNEISIIFRRLNINIHDVISAAGSKWNFQKYLVDKDGNLIDYWYSLTSPMSSKITNYIK